MPNNTEMPERIWARSSGSWGGDALHSAHEYLRADLAQAQLAQSHTDHWRDAVIEAAKHYGIPEADCPSPNEGLRALLAAVLDPAVSHAAAKLKSDARAEGVREGMERAAGICAQTARRYRSYDHAAAVLGSTTCEDAIRAELEALPKPEAQESPAPATSDLSHSNYREFAGIKPAEDWQEARELVLKTYPTAYCSQRFKSAEIYLSLGTGPTELAAWIDAASRLDKEGE